MKEITLMKPTTEAVKKFNDLLKDQHKADTIRKMRVAHEKLKALKSKWDWSNILVKDETSGMYGVKDVAGKMLVATEFDEIGHLGYYDPEYYCAVIAVRNGNKWSFIHADGTGEYASDIRFDYLEYIPSTTDLYIAKWGGTNTLGIVNDLGTVIYPNILTKIGKAENGLFSIEKDGKVGAINKFYEVVHPIYDSWTIEENNDVLFKTGPIVGYVSTRTGIFVPKSDASSRNYIGLSDFFLSDFK